MERYRRIARICISVAIAVVMLPALVIPGTLAQAPEASPAGEPALPDGPLGEQAEWLLGVANAGAGKLRLGDINAHFHPSYFQENSAPELYSQLTDLQSAGITYEIELETFATSRDMPATNGNFVLVGSDGSRTVVGMTVDRESGQITNFMMQPESGDVTAEATPEGDESTAVATPEAEVPEEASPVAELALPEGPLGEQAAWLLGVANAGAGKLRLGDINAHFHPSYFQENSAPELYSQLTELQSAGITYEIEMESFITTMDLPATNGNFILVGSDGSRTQVSMTVDRENGQITNFLLQPEGGEVTEEASPAAEATPEASPVVEAAMPEGAIGEQAEWLLSVANAGAGKLRMQDINAHFHPSYFQENPASELYAQLSELQSAGITYFIEMESFITTLDLPATNGSFVMVGSDDSRTRVGITIDPESGQITDFSLEPEG